ncbi:MAG: hypothetical protein HN646_02640 [Nitrospina sp.]|nr:hypothetical protein [Nitrospina sp.]
MGNISSSASLLGDIGWLCSLRHEYLPKQCGSSLLRNTWCGFYAGCL